MALADEFENPKTHIEHVYKELRQDFAGNSALKKCEESAIKEYLSTKLGNYISTQNVLTDIGFKLAKDSLAGMEDDFKNQLDAEFTTFLIQDNLSAIKQFCSALDLKTLSSNVDYTVSSVTVSLKLANNKSSRFDVMLYRGWDHWLVFDIYSKNKSLQDKYRNLFGKTIMTEGYAGLLKQLAALNQKNAQ